MANSSESLGLQYTARSISLPSRLHHPNSIRIEAELNKLKNWEATTSLSIEDGLIRLAELYNSTQELLESPTTQEAVVRHQNGILVEESLERSVDLLDSCGAIRDNIFTLKGHVHVLQLALRRKNGDSSIEKDISTYLCFRKKVKKEVAKSLTALKQMQNRTGSSSTFLSDVDYNLAMIVRVLREVNAITISFLRTILLSLASPTSSGKKGWSLIGKLMTTKAQAPPHKGHIVNNVEDVDIALVSLRGCIKNGDNKADVLMAREQLQMLESSIVGLETGLEYLFRQLVQNRVALLNLLTH